jgi:hypothetical protein
VGYECLRYTPVAARDSILRGSVCGGGLARRQRAFLARFLSAAKNLFSAAINLREVGIEPTRIAPFEIT